MVEQKPTWSDVKKQFKELGKSSYDSEETEESKRIRVAQKKLSASEDPSVYGKFMENSTELNRFELAYTVSPLIYISAFLFSDLDRLKNFSAFSKYYVIAWIVYCVVTLLVFAIAHHSYLQSKTLLSMPLEFWVTFKDKEDPIQRRRLDLKSGLAQHWQYKWSRRLVTIGAFVSGIGVLTTTWEVWKAIT